MRLEHRRRILDRAARRAGEAVALDVQRTVEALAPELARYCEIVVGPGQSPFGLMVRGEGSDFTARAADIIARWGLDAEVRLHHRRMAEFFDHTRSFLKLEWYPGNERLVAVYYRRRPPLDTALRLLSAAGLTPDGISAAVAMATSLGKRTVHFVAAAARTGRPLHHKLYFSQWVTDSRRAAVVEGLTAVAHQMGVEDAWSRWRPVHDRLLAHLPDTTLFVSLNLTAERLVPGFKVDYPDADPIAAAEILPPSDRRGAIDEMLALAGLLDRRRLSYLGVRFDGGEMPRLKSYLDLPTVDAARIS